MSFNATSQIRCSLQRSTLSDPINSLVRAAGIARFITLSCCVHKATVGAKNQTSCVYGLRSLECNDYMQEDLLSLEDSDRARPWFAELLCWCIMLSSDRNTWSFCENQGLGDTTWIIPFCLHVRLSTPSIHLCVSVWSNNIRERVAHCDDNISLHTLFIHLQLIVPATMLYCILAYLVRIVDRERHCNFRGQLTANLELHLGTHVDVYIYIGPGRTAVWMAPIVLITNIVIRYLMDYR